MPLSKPYNPYGSCVELWKNKDRFRCIHGPVGTGKTLACGVMLYIQAKKYPGSRSLIVRKTRADLTNSTLDVMESFLPPSIIGKGRRSNRISYRFNNGSEILLGPLDDPQRWQSANLDHIYIEEAIECDKRDFEYLNTRLRNNKMDGHYLTLCTNPGSSTHWIKQLMDVGKVTSIQSTWADNPYLPEGYIESIKDTCTGVRYDRLCKGIWSKNAGCIFETFERETHVNHLNSSPSTSTPSSRSPSSTWIKRCTGRASKSS